MRPSFFSRNLLVLVCVAAQLPCLCALLVNDRPRTHHDEGREPMLTRARTKERDGDDAPLLDTIKTVARMVEADQKYGTWSCRNSSVEPFRVESNDVHFVLAVRGVDDCPTEFPYAYRCSLEAAVMTNMSVTAWVLHEDKICPTIKFSTYTMRALELDPDTRLGALYIKNKEAFRKLPLAHLSDFGRLYVLHTHGGTYLDTDVVVLRNDFNSLPQGVGAQYDGLRFYTWHRYNNAVMRLNRGSQFMEELITSWEKTWPPTNVFGGEGYEWGDYGPYLITATIVDMKLKRTCDIDLFKKDIFYPEQKRIDVTPTPYAWHGIYGTAKQLMTSCKLNSDLAKMMDRRCPTTAHDRKRACKVA